MEAFLGRGFAREGVGRRQPFFTPGACVARRSTAREPRESGDRLSAPFRKTAGAENHVAIVLDFVNSTKSAPCSLVQQQSIVVS